MMLLDNYLSIGTYILLTQFILIVFSQGARRNDNLYQKIPSHYRFSKSREFSNKRPFQSNIIGRTQRLPFPGIASGIRGGAPHKLSQRYFRTEGLPKNNGPSAGPNRCRGGFTCCPGWSMNPGTRQCTVPACRNPCGFGICRSPNLCQCMSGGFSKYCSRPGGGAGGAPSGACNSGCMNGGACQGSKCVCRQGYVGLNCQKPICKNHCLNNGRCIGPDRCACPYGYTGKRCELDHRLGPCFTKIERNMCRNQLSGVKCSRASCCSTVGAAWGVPCQRCPAKRDCKKGLYKDPKTGKCVDINECRGIPNICAMGTCVNTLGSYRCECGAGRYYNKDKFECSDWNECETHKHLCEFGKCVNLEGSFKCECDKGFVTSDGDKRCVKKRVLGKCYLSFANRCIRKANRRISEHECCCGNTQRAFGYCKSCPQKGTRGYRAIGCDPFVPPTNPHTKGNGTDSGRSTGGGGDGTGTGTGGSTTGSGSGGDGEACDPSACSNGKCYNGKCTCNVNYVNDAVTGLCVFQGGDEKCDASGICNNGQCSVSDDDSKVCECKPGFAKNELDICVPIETESCKAVGECGNGLCNSQGGKQICTCNVGYTKNENNECIRAEDKSCTTEGKCTNGRCEFENGVNVCVCQTGYKKNFNNVCDKSADQDCAEDGTCSGGTCKKDGSKDVCECDKTFGKSSNGKCVEKADVMCQVGDSCKNGNCIVEGGTKVCACSAGFGKNEAGLCEKKADEKCAVVGVCQNGNCETHDEKHVCVCNDGHAKDKNGFCVLKADEKCKVTGKCNNGKCVTAGSDTVCSCKSGFVMNELNMCAKEKCADGEVKNINGYCVRIVEKGCVDDDGCVNGRCGSEKVCKCYDGFGKDANGECTRKVPKLCEGVFDACTNGRCQGEGTSRECVCNGGYGPNQDNICIDKNECNKGDAICNGGKCINTAGGFKCKCSSGYQKAGNGLTCEDENECAANANICPNGKCNNLVGSFSCQCDVGYQADVSGKACVDVNECDAGGICPANAVCDNTVGSFACNCVAGYTMVDGKCVDVDECSGAEEACPNGKCVNAVGTFTCVCDEGFTADGNQCKDVDECSTIAGICPGGTCVNNGGSFSCECNEGFKVTSDGKDCIDMTPGNCFAKFNGLTCEMPLMKQLSKASCCCGMESCTSTRAWGDSCSGCPVNGTAEFTKLCPYGCGADPTDGKNINECENNMGMTIGVCPNGRCRDLPGDYQCTCNPGFRLKQGSNKDCEDVNECTELNLCQGGTCTNTKGGYTCLCSKGFRYNPLAKTCVDDNECLRNPCIGGKCENTKGGFKCICPQGSTLDEANNLCRDTQRGGCFSVKSEGECKGKVASHLSYSGCCNGGGKFWGPDCLKCSTDSVLGCPKGKMREGTQCVDIDECVFSNACVNGHCQNTDGSYTCTCPQGYVLDATGTACEDMRNGTCYRSQCKMSFGNKMKKSTCCCNGFSAWGDKLCELCPVENTEAYNDLCKNSSSLLEVDVCQFKGLCKNGRCTNTGNSFRCDCDAGFGVDETGTMCLDYDECKITTGICGPGQCMNTHGSFRCKCNNGYRNAMMMEMCVDINECKEMKPSPCQRGSCINTPGSFRCECPTGFKTMGAAIACEDVDECEDPNICPNGVCQNFLGGYHCACAIGYRPGPFMKKCYDIDECNVNNGGCEYSCTNTDGSYQCLCQVGFELREDGRTCKDIDECKRGTPCGQGNTCTNTIGGYVCTCTIGYRLSNDARACIDVDECKDGLSCRNGNCINTAGSFDCQCRVGYRLEENAMACIDIDECKAEDSKCHKDARCLNNVGSFNCQCKPGYDGDGFDCIDTDECALGLSNCALDSQCVNTVGSFGCQCKPGFTGDGEVCLDINECAKNTTLCAPGECMNKNGGYVCDCPEGFQANAQKTECIDIDECSEVDGTCEHGFCHNSVGGFTCTCEQGFEQDASKSKCVDINECDTNDMCKNGVCKNMMGMFKCLCDKTKGFIANPTETACIDMREGTCVSKFDAEEPAGGDGGAGDSCTAVPLSDKKLMKQSCCCTAQNGVGWVDTKTGAREECPPVFSAEYKKMCPGGPSTVINETTNEIKKVDGCSVLPNYCKAGTCVDNGKEGVSCQCPNGYKFNGCTLGCEDIKECDTEGICGYGAKCVEEDKSYGCICPEGYDYNAETKFCVDNRKYTCFLIGNNPDGCVDPYVNVTIGQCCCSDGMQGSKYGETCKVCPARKTGQYGALCFGKPKLPDVETGQPPLKPPTKAPFTDIHGSIVPTDENGVTLYPTNQPAPTDENGHTIFATVRPGVGKLTHAPHFVTDKDGKIVGVIPTDENGVTKYPHSHLITDKSGRVIGVIPTDENGVTLYKPGMPITDENGQTVYGTYAPHTVAKTKKPIHYIRDKDGNIIGVVPTDENGVTLFATNQPPPTDANGVTLYGTYAPPKATIDPKHRMDMCKVMDDVCGKGKCIDTVNGYNCECNMGFEQGRVNGKKTCKDIDECQPTNPCVKGICNNMDGAFHCSCHANMTLDKDDPHKCVDLNECVTEGYCEDGECENIPNGGGFTCSCNKGFMKSIDKKTCKDINECLMPGICGNGNCVNEKGTYRCDCNAGYELNALGKCVDKDECSSVDNVCAHGSCANTEGGFKCTCEEGFVEHADGTSCIDLNECDDAAYCENGVCTNTEGSATCTCIDGFKKSEDGRTCEDIDECDKYAGLCPQGTCVNLKGSWMCRCDAGYEGTAENQKCQDINECSDPNYCVNGQCRNTEGGAICTCNLGYVSKTDTYCGDIDECSEENPPCEFGGTCVNTAGGYSCICKPGFIFDPVTRDCTDVRTSHCFAELDTTDNRCTTTNSLNVSKSICCCSMNAGWGDPCELCPDKKSKEFLYYCPKGAGYNREDKDINECEHNLGKCTNGKCINTDGSYMCACDEGYKPNPNNKNECVDVDECSEIDNVCGYGSCTNNVGSYQCECQAGFEPGVDSPSCVDINECKTNNNKCAFRCRNTRGSYQCVCPRGLTVAADGIHCEDINECEDNPHLCPFTCKNLVGSYKCLCPAGYTRDARGKCHDIDECSQPGGEQLCLPGGQCQNVQSTYRCDCKAPYMKSNNEKHCFDKRMKLCFSNVVHGNCEVSLDEKMEKVTQAQCCCTLDTNAWGTNCELCPSPNSDRRRQLCLTELVKNGTNECKFISGVCKNGKCMDTEKSFRCMCNDGFKLSMNGQKCLDKDECADGSAQCPGECKNTEGGFECLCPKGFVINEDKTQCVDENECETGNHDCPNLCVNTEGGFKCTCPDGYRLIGGGCSDINECLEPGICAFGNCQNTEGSYTCTCGRGLKFDKDKKACVYIVETTQPPTTGRCNNPQSGCGCPQGYFPYFNPYGINQCVDVNECRQNMCGQSSCINTLGSFQCTCPTGFQFKEGGCKDTNECSRSPCSYGCSNNRGGFACQCPAGYYPVAGGHCVATHGVHCVQCDTSDIPSEGVPLEGEPSLSEPTLSQTAARSYESAIRDVQVPLGGASDQGYDGSNVHFYPRGGQQPQPRGQQQQQIQPGGYHRMEAQRSPYYPSYNPSYRSTYGQYQDYSQQQGQYGYSGYNYRKRRSVSYKKEKPIIVTVSRNAASNTTLVKMVAVLKDMSGKMTYGLTHGNVTLFTLNTDSPRITYLRSTEKLPPGKYTIGISGDYIRSSDSNSSIEQLVETIYNGVRKLYLKIVVKVV